MFFLYIFEYFGKKNTNLVFPIVFTLDFTGWFCYDSHCLKKHIYADMAQ